MTDTTMPSQPLERPEGNNTNPHQGEDAVSILDQPADETAKTTSCPHWCQRSHGEVSGDTAFHVWTVSSPNFAVQIDQAFSTDDGHILDRALIAIRDEPSDVILGMEPDDARELAGLLLQAGTMLDSIHAADSGPS